MLKTGKEPLFSFNILQRKKAIYNYFEIAIIYYSLLMTTDVQ